MSGLVSIVGAGPGDPGLLTLRAADRLRRCDCVVYDHLASPRLLALTPAGCEQIYAGKEAGNHALPQEALNALLAQKAKEGKRVVRLKGGDPYVFGRGGEEALYLKGAGVPFEVVPGVTSAVAGPCCAGIPITHRGLATSFHVYTAASRTGEDPVDWAAAARQEGTLVFLMGLSRLENTCRKLLENGLPPDTPAAVVSRATTPLQRTVRAPLGELAAAVRAAKLPPPAITVVGQVASLGGALDCFEERPLFGRTVVTTRQKTHGFDLSAALEEAGAQVERLDAIRIRPCPGEDLQRAFARLGEYSYLIFTSQNAVRIFLEELRRSGRDLPRHRRGPGPGGVGSRPDPAPPHLHRAVGGAGRPAGAGRPGPLPPGQSGAGKAGGMAAHPLPHRPGGPLRDIGGRPRPGRRPDNPAGRGGRLPDLHQPFGGGEHPARPRPRFCPLSGGHQDRQHRPGDQRLSARPRAGAVAGERALHRRGDGPAHRRRQPGLNL